jgi:hypothetical protein
MFDNLIFKEDDCFYIDLNESLDVDVRMGDLIKFSFNKEKYLAKVIEGKYKYDKFFELQIVKKI